MIRKAAAALVALSSLALCTTGPDGAARAQTYEPLGKAAWSVVSNHRIIVGTISAFHGLDETRLKEFYGSYVLDAKREHPGAEPSMSIEQFSRSIAGWVKVKYGISSGFGGNYQVALVPMSLKEQVAFSSYLGATVVNQSADLAAAKSNADGYFVIDAVLCKDGPAFHDCARHHEKGYFDADTGIQLTPKFTPMVPGRKIDLASYKVVD